MTNADARALLSGDRIRPAAQIGWDVNPSVRDTFTL